MLTRRILQEHHFENVKVPLLPRESATFTIQKWYFFVEKHPNLSLKCKTKLINRFDCIRYLTFIYISFSGLQILFVLIFYCIIEKVR